MSDALDRYRDRILTEVEQAEQARDADRARIDKAANVASALRALGHDAAMTLDGRITLNLTADQAAAVAALGPLPLDS